MKKVLCHLSGGLDSMLSAIVVGESSKVSEFSVIFINYGQPYLEGERRGVEYAVEFLKKRFGDKFASVESVRCFLALSSEGLGWPREYIPVRNLVLTAIAANYALSRGYDSVAVGNKSPVLRPEDPHSYPDTTCGFYSELSKIVRMGVGDKVPFEVVHPLLWSGERWPREVVLEQLVARGVDMQQLWSCYSPHYERGYCGVCPHCKEIKEAGYWSHFSPELRGLR